MRKTFLHIGFGIFAFIVSLAIVFLFAYRPSFDLETGKNTCQECLDFSKTKNLETKTFSEILHNKDLQEKKVRIKALFVHDAGYIFLRDLENRKQTTPAGFDKNAIFCSETEKTLQVCTGYKTWYDSSVELTVVGYLGRIDEETNPFQGGENGFNIVCIEQVNATDEELKNWKAMFEKSIFDIWSAK